MNALIQEAQSVDAGDQTQVKSNTFKWEPPAEGRTIARFVGYVEIGVRKQRPFKGEPKPDCMEALIYFELLGKKHAKEIEVDGVKKTIYPVHRERVKVMSSERSSFFKLFKAMDYGRGKIHMKDMLGEAFLLDLKHTVKGERTYVNLYHAGIWAVSAPLDMEGEPVAAPEATSPFKLLLWNAPSELQWESIFIDGTRTAKDEDGNEVEVSNNRIQNDIIENAVNFAGSAVEAIHNKANNMLDLDGGQSAVESAPVQEKPVVAENVVEAPVKKSDDILADYLS